MKRQNEYPVSPGTAAFAAAVVVFLVLAASCGTQKKVQTITKARPVATLTLPKENDFLPEIDSLVGTKNDTLIIKDLNGNDVFVMKTYKDESGEEMASERLQAAVVTARFRNVAERHGKVDIAFQITVPAMMMDDNWQLRFYPRMAILGDTIKLEKVIITGASYRKAQLRGYQQYERWLARIVNDTTKFVDVRNLEIFLERNIPEVYYFKNDTTFVTDEEFKSVFGVTEQRAIDHYTNHLAKHINNWRKSRKALMYRKYVRVPIDEDRVRLDTVISKHNGDFVYEYVQTIKTRPKLRKVDILLSGDIYESDDLKYKMPDSEPLAFFISSVSSFMEHIVRFKKRIVERRVEANASFHIEFPVGKAFVDPELGDNARELEQVRSNIRSVMVLDDFVLDSVTVAAYASPEGSFSSNEALSAKRAAAASDYFSRYVKYLRDSLMAEEGMNIVLDEGVETITKADRSARTGGITFLSRSGGENWGTLGTLVNFCDWMTPEEKEGYWKIYDSHNNLDMCEQRLKKEPYYKKMRDSLYPKLRVVDVNFSLHRKGMVKDTIHTTEEDLEYKQGLMLLADRDYEAALEYLRDYDDINTAICYLSLDRNENARLILERLPESAKVNYMLAIAYARKGNVRGAVELYMKSCQQDRTYISRGNLDPEITALIRDYNLNKEPDDEFGDLGF